MSSTTPGPATDSDTAFQELYPAIIECFGIILLGYVAGRSGVISPANSKGLGNYVTYFALPALVFTAMVEMDFSEVNWLFWSGILISKTIIFATVYLGTLLIGRSTDVGRAGIFAIFTSQSNDFALGYPIISAIYKDLHPDFVGYLYLVGPISLAFLNPIGFFSMEIQQNRRSTNQHSRITMCGHALKGLITNPIIIMVVLGIIFNFIFAQTLPQVISQFLNVLANSFSATALFFLGIGMVDKLKNTSSMFFLTPILLIGCKLIFLPLVTRQVVLLLNPGGADANLTDSFASYGFLYGTIPTAPSVYMFATLYQQSEDVIATSMVLCTFAAAPIMFITATMVNMPVMTLAQSNYYLSQAMLYSGSIGMACCVWILIVFILSKRYNLIPHHFTTHLVIAQLLSSLGCVLCHVALMGNSYWANILTSVVLLVGVFSSRCWAALVAVALCLIRCRSLCFVLRFRYWFYIYGWVLPCVLVGIIVAVAPNPESVTTPQSAIFQYGMWQLIASVCILSINLLLAVSALVVLHRRDRYRHAVVSSDTNSESASDINDSHSQRNGLETERMLKIQSDNVDIEDLHSRVYNTCAPVVGCAHCQRERCRRQVQQHFINAPPTPASEDGRSTGSAHQVGRHILLLLFLLLSMIVGLTVCVWQVTSEDNSSLYLMLEYLDTVLAYCQGFFTLAVFGFDTENVIIPFYNVLRRVFCNKVDKPSPSIDEETLHIVQQFNQHHIETCKRDLFHDIRIGPQVHQVEEFHGAELVDWLVEVGLATDRKHAAFYSTCLLCGKVIAIVASGSDGLFHDDRSAYRFCTDEESESLQLHVVS